MTTVTVDGVVYEKASTLAKRFKYTTDYIGQLCRAKKVDAQLIGRSWYVNPESLESHKESRYAEKANDRDIKTSKIKISKGTNSQSDKLKAKAVKPKISLSPVVKAAVATKTKTSNDVTGIAIRKIDTRIDYPVVNQTFRQRPKPASAFKQSDKKQPIVVDTFGTQTISKKTSLETNFASRLPEAQVNYKVDETDLSKLAKKTTQALLDVELAEAEKLKIKSLAKPTKLVADELPKITLKGDLTITSLNEIFPVDEDEVDNNLKNLKNKDLSDELVEKEMVKIKVGQSKILDKTTKISASTDKKFNNLEEETDEVETLSFTNYKKTPVLKQKDELELSLPNLFYPSKSLSVSLTPQSIKIAEINHTKDSRLKIVAWLTVTVLALVLLALFVVESSLVISGTDTSSSLKFSNSGWQEFLSALSS